MMIIKTLMKNAVLVTGILMVVIFFFNMKKKGIFFDKERFNPSSCRSAVVMLERRKPKEWSVKCQNNDMTIHIERGKELSWPRDEKNQKKMSYMELANHLSFVAKNSFLESLENVNNITIIYIVPSSTIKAFTTGKEISRLNTLKDVELISLHLKNTVKIQVSAR